MESVIIIIIIMYNRLIVRKIKYGYISLHCTATANTSGKPKMKNPCTPQTRLVPKLRVYKPNNSF